MTTPTAGNGPPFAPEPPTAPEPGPPPDVASGAAPARRTGRPAKLPDPVVEAAILTALRAGSPRGIAAEHAGIGKRTLFEYLARADTEGDRLRSKAAAFRDAMRKAEADCAAGMVANVLKAAQLGDAKAAQWFLARRYPKEFGERTLIELKVAGEREAMLDVLKARLPDALYREVLGDLAARDTVGDDGEA